ncbi:EAL domain-containing protein [Glutamicibacter soli]|uniref:EAL domain-containing protein n=1 Tax=Glutamicibacter soli TaxID=453836 RepID=A0A6L9G506_9MICC|nr:EAL domain-containing protein [Glutamicibacter soli]
MKFVFQPLIDLRNKTLLGFEALTRFDDGRGPQEHFSQARAEGRLIDLELEAIRGILEASRELPDGYLVTLNASGPTIEAFAAAALQLDARLVWGLELNEESEPCSSGRARQYADTLGCLLLIDDAGVAYANRERIECLHPDIVKLDRSMITNYGSSAKVRGMVANLLEAARETGAKTLAEGIETPEHLDLIDELGFSYAQGFYYSRGLPAQELAGAMHELNRRVGIDIPGF